MKTVYFSSRSPEFAVKTLIELLRLSNKYRNGVKRRTFLEPQNLSCDIEVIQVSTDAVADSSALILDIPENTSLKGIYSEVERLAIRNGLI